MTTTTKNLIGVAKKVREFLDIISSADPFTRQAEQTALYRELDQRIKEAETPQEDDNENDAQFAREHDSVSEETRNETQQFAISAVLVDHCGYHLSPDRVEEIMGEIVNAMRKGPCAWAFKPEHDKCP
jgi:hypothetical protein